MWRVFADKIIIAAVSCRFKKTATKNHLVFVFRVFFPAVRDVCGTLVGNDFGRDHVAVVEGATNVDRRTVDVATPDDCRFRNRLADRTCHPPVCCNSYNNINKLNKT